MDPRKPYFDAPEYHERVTLDDYWRYCDSVIPENDDDDCEPTRDDEYRAVYDAIMEGDIIAINDALRNITKLPY